MKIQLNWNTIWKEFFFFIESIKNDLIENQKCLYLYLT